MDKILIILILFIFFIVSTTVFWMHKDTIPLAWDAAGYGKESIRFYRSIQKNDHIFENYLNLLGRRKTPLLAIMPIPFYLLIGVTKFASLLPNIILLLITICFFYYLVRMFFDKLTGLLAAVILFTMPLTYGMSRQLYPDFFIMCFSIWCFLGLIKSNYFYSKKWNIFLGLSIGLGFMTKSTFFSVITLPILFHLYKRVKSEKFRQAHALAVDLLWVVIPALFIFGLWYSHNFLVLAWQIKRSAYGSASLTTSLGPIFAPKTIYLYWVRVINHGIGFYYMLILLLASGWLLFRKKFTSRPSMVLALWFLAPFILQTFGSTKELRYILPAFPPIAILIAHLVTKIFQKVKYKLGLLILFLFPTISYLNTSFYILSYIPDIQVGQFILIKDSIEYPGHRIAYRFENQNWPNYEILKFIADNSSNRLDPRFVIIQETNSLSSYTLEYFRVKDELPFKHIIKYSSISDATITPSPEKAIEHVLNSEFVLTQIGSKQEATLSNNYGEKITQDLLDNKLPFRATKEFALPDKTKALLYKKIRQF